MDEDLVNLGVSTRLFALPKPPNDVVVIGGVADEERWTRVVSRRAAHALWYYLTVLLYPERERQITTRAATAPIRGEEAPTITAHVEVFRGEGGFIEMLGSGGQTEWLTRIDEREARSLWGALDRMLFPLGWEGSGRRSPKPPDT